MPDKVVDLMFSDNNDMMRQPLLIKQCVPAKSRDSKVGRDAVSGGADTETVELEVDADLIILGFIEEESAGSKNRPD